MIKICYTKATICMTGLINDMIKKIAIYIIMPYSIRKVSKKNCYRVKNTKTKRIMAKCTTKERATRQMRLLRGIQNSRKFAKQVRRSRKKGNK